MAHVMLTVRPETLTFGLVAARFLEAAAALGQASIMCGSAGQFPLARDRSAPVSDHRHSAGLTPGTWRATRPVGRARAAKSRPLLCLHATYAVCGMRDVSCRIRIECAPPDHSAHGLGFARNRSCAKQGSTATLDHADHQQGEQNVRTSR